MGITTTASNISNTVGKWKPYYFKPFMLGRQGTGVGSTDGNIYITQTVGDSNSVVRGSCTSSVNCRVYYILTFDNDSSTRYFYVKKYEKNTDTLIDFITASDTSGDGVWWKPVRDKSYTIDVGVNLYFGTPNFDDDDEYKITLPSTDTMDRRKIYHGGYSSFLRMPDTEGKAYHSDIIPTGLKGKNITVVFNPNNGLFPSGNKGLSLALSKEDLVGNQAVSLALEWSVDKDNETSTTAGSDSASFYTWGTHETWQLGTLFADDINPNDDDDVPFVSNFPSSDVEFGNNKTGLLQRLNITVSGRAGYARIKTEYMTGAGTPSIAAFNQHWPIILLIS